MSKGELFEQEGPESGTPELDQLMLTMEEPLDHASFALASPSVTRAPLWKFADENPKVYSQAQAQPITRTPVKPLGSQFQRQAPAQAGPQAPAPAPAQARTPRLAQATSATGCCCLVG